MSSIQDKRTGPSSNLHSSGIKAGQKREKMGWKRITGDFVETLIEQKTKRYQKNICIKPSIISPYVLRDCDTELCPKQPSRNELVQIEVYKGS
jgi:hypothetical protein